jgi:hypothetical protein
VKTSYRVSLTPDQWRIVLFALLYVAEQEEDGDINSDTARRAQQARDVVKGKLPFEVTRGE